MRTGEVNELRDLCARWAQASEVHLEKGSPLFLVRSKKLFNQGCSAVKSRIDGRKSVGADEGNDPAALPAQMIDSLNQCIDGHLILVMAVLLGSGRAERVSLVDDEYGPAIFTGGG